MWNRGPDGSWGCVPPLMFDWVRNLSSSSRAATKALELIKRGLWGVWAGIWLVTRAFHKRGAAAQLLVETAALVFLSVFLSISFRTWSSSSPVALLWNCSLALPIFAAEHLVLHVALVVVVPFLNKGISVQMLCHPWGDLNVTPTRDGLCAQLGRSLHTCSLPCSSSYFLLECFYMSEMWQVTDTCLGRHEKKLLNSYAFKNLKEQ